MLPIHAHRPSWRRQLLDISPEVSSLCHEKRLNQHICWTCQVHQFSFRKLSLLVSVCHIVTIHLNLTKALYMLCMYMRRGKNTHEKRWLHQKFTQILNIPRSFLESYLFLRCHESHAKGHLSCPMSRWQHQSGPTLLIHLCLEESIRIRKEMDKRQLIESGGHQ